MLRETDTDRERQRRALDAVAAHGGATAHTFTSTHGVDGWLERAGKVVAFVEGKGVRGAITDRPFVTLAVQKYASLARHNDLDPDAPGLIAFAFDDAVGYTRLDRYTDGCELVVFGRNDRGTPEIEPGLRYPTPALTIIGYLP